MSATGSPRKAPPASPSGRFKRKATDIAHHAGPLTVAGSSRTASTSPFAPTSAASTPSPVTRLSVSSSSRRNSRQARTFQISDDFDQDEDAPYDEELDADGEYDQDFYGQNAQDEEDDDLRPIASSSASTVTPARQSARPKRSHAPDVSYYSVQPLPSLSDDEQDVTPSIRRRARKAKLQPTSDGDVDMVNDDDSGPAPPTSASRGTPFTSKQALSKTPRRPSDQDSIEQGKQNAVKPIEAEMSEEAKQHAKAEKEAHDLQSRWTEEYFEIVEQLPLEMHRTFALMRELEGQMQTRVDSMVHNMAAYRDARLEMQKRLDSAPHEHSSTHDDHSRCKSIGAASEDEAENLLGGSQEAQNNGQPPTPPGENDDIEISSADGNQATNLLDKDTRRQLLRSISAAANESVKAAEEKMGLAATAYNWIDRHIRRLDADISKLESSILLGLRSGTEESRGAREALGLPVDDQAEAEGADEQAQDGQAVALEAVSAEAESASLAKAAGARRASASGAEATGLGGRRSARSTPKMGGQARLAPSPKVSERGLSRSRSRSLSAAAAAAIAAEKATSTASSRAARQKTTSPAPLRRKRKPKPLSPQKGGRRSIVRPTLVSPNTQTHTVGPDTSEMPFDPTEPTYCYCDQISFDEMVACDNDDCTIEWFHYKCVGLTSQPKDEWFCRFCAPKGWKGEGMAVPPNAKHRPPGFRKGIGIRA